MSRAPRLADYEEVLSSLDAYGHLIWTAGYSDDDDDESAYDWMACFDYRVFRKWEPDGPFEIAYHVVVDSDSSGFVDTADEDVVKLHEAPYDLVRDYTLDQAFEYMNEADLEAMEETNKEWNEALREDIVPSVLRTWFPLEMAAADAAMETRDPDALEDAWVGLESLIERQPHVDEWLETGPIPALQRVQQLLYPEGSVRRRT